MAYYKIEHGSGVSVVQATSLERARSDAYAEYGSRNLKSVTTATDGEVDWFRAMGGYIYEV
jgi:hypothetical protein